MPSLRCGNTTATAFLFVLGFVALGVGIALYEGELFLLSTNPNLPKSLAWEVSMYAFYIAIAGFVGGIVSLFIDR